MHNCAQPTTVLCMPTNTTVRIDRTKLRAARIEAGLNQAELAKYAQVTPQWISALETGVKDRIGAHRLTRICRALKCRKADLKAPKAPATPVVVEDGESR